MDCKHEIEKLVGIAGGVYCRGCGKTFDHIPKQEAPKKETPKDDAPVKKTARKAPAKKGAK